MENSIGLACAKRSECTAHIGSYILYAKRMGPLRIARAAEHARSGQCKGMRKPSNCGVARETIKGVHVVG